MAPPDGTESETKKDVEDVKKQLRAAKKAAKMAAKAAEPPPLSACTSPLECFKLMLAHIGAAITAMLFYSRALLVGRLAFLARGFAGLRVLLMSSIRVSLPRVAAGLGTRAFVVSNAARVALRTYGMMLVRLLIAFIVGLYHQLWMRAVRFVIGGFKRDALSAPASDDDSDGGDSPEDRRFKLPQLRPVALILGGILLDRVVLPNAARATSASLSAAAHLEQPLRVTMPPAYVPPIAPPRFGLRPVKARRAAFSA